MKLLNDTIVLIHHKNTSWFGKITGNSIDNSYTYTALTEGYDQTITCEYSLPSEWIVDKGDNIEELKLKYPELFI